MGKIFKLKLLTDATKNDGFIDLYVKADTITGFYIPEKNAEYDSINIFHDGGISTILQEKHITDYLNETFVQKSIELSDVK